jgi:hypothetical protein
MNLRNNNTDIILSKPRREFLKKSFKYSCAKLEQLLSVSERGTIYFFL